MQSLLLKEISMKVVKNIISTSKTCHLLKEYSCALRINSNPDVFSHSIFITFLNKIFRRISHWIRENFLQSLILFLLFFMLSNTLIHFSILNEQPLQLLLRIGIVFILLLSLLFMNREKKEKSPLN